MPLPRRPHRLEIHWDDQEWAMLRERCAAAGAPTLAAYVRAAALGRPLPTVAAPAVPAINVQAHAELGRVGANLNQLLRHLNVGNVLTEHDLAPTLRALHARVQEVRRLLLGETDAA